MIPFSVALEERLASLSHEEQLEEEKKIGSQSALGKITNAGKVAACAVTVGPRPTPS